MHIQVLSIHQVINRHSHSLVMRLFGFSLLSICSKFKVGHNIHCYVFLPSLRDFVEPHRGSTQNRVVRWWPDCKNSPWRLDALCHGSHASLMLAWLSSWRRYWPWRWNRAPIWTTAMWTPGTPISNYHWSSPGLLFSEVMIFHSGNFYTWAE